MARKLYTADDSGSISVIVGHNAWGVDIPAFVYDIWGPLIGVKAIGVYGTYCRLGVERIIYGRTVKELAAAMRISDNSLVKINALLVDCGFISIETPRGWQRKANWTTRITVLEPPRAISSELMEKYSKNGDTTTYRPLAHWLADEALSSRYPATRKPSSRQVAITKQSPDSDANNDPLEMIPQSYSHSQSSCELRGPISDSSKTRSPSSGALDHSDTEDQQRAARQDNPDDQTPWERWLLLTCGRKKPLSETDRGHFSRPIEWMDDSGSIQTALSVSELWDTNTDFQRFVKDVIWLELRNMNQVNVTAFRKWLVTPKTYARFDAWAKKHGHHTLHLDESETAAETEPPVEWAAPTGEVRVLMNEAKTWRSHASKETN